MEYYGIVDQVYYDVYVSSQTRFRDFAFDKYTYRYIASKTLEGIDRPSYSGGIAVTNLERTIVDSIKDIDKIAGIEEVVQDIECLHRVQEKKLANWCNLDRSYFGKIFKDTVLVTPQEYIIRYRINVACDLLKDTDLSIGDISAQVGYDNQLHFSRAFKKVMGISPRDWKKRNRIPAMTDSKE